MTKDAFAGWAILELMGHRRLAGYVQEATLAGGAFVRIDVPGELVTSPTGEQWEQGAATQFYSPGAVYCITPTTEEIARTVASRGRPAPVSRWELEPARTPDDQVIDDPDDDLGF